MFTFRLLQLTRSALKILRRHGPAILLERLKQWLTGYYRFYDPDNPDTYAAFCRRFDPDKIALVRQRIESRLWANAPFFSIVTAASDAKYMAATRKSIHDQTYGRWQWLVADTNPDSHVSQYLQLAINGEPRIITIKLPDKPSTDGINAALRAASGDFVLIVEPGDTIAPSALFEIARLLRQHPEADAIYSDLDHLDQARQRVSPLFKPDWSAATMRSYNLLAYLGIFRRSLLDQVGYFDETCMDSAYDAYCLSISEHAAHIYHIPTVLYHRTLSDDPSQNALPTHHQPANSDLQIGSEIDQPQSNRHVTIIIPSKDHDAILKRCLDSLFTLTSYAHFDVTVIDTGSTDPAVNALYDVFSTDQASRFRVIHYKEPVFNFSKACNLGAQQARGGLLLFLNNDTEIVEKNWLTRMVRWFDEERVGIVGAKLLYADGSIQHAGVIVGMQGTASHVFIGENEHTWTAFGSDDWYRDLLAVTGACLLIARPVFEAVNGFDEGFLLNYSDVDLCLRVFEAGYRIIYSPDVRLVHHEVLTHGSHIPRSDFERASQRWQHWFKRGDPYFNPNLSYLSNVPKLKASSIDSASAINSALMARLPRQAVIMMPDDLD